MLLFQGYRVRKPSSNELRSSLINIVFENRSTRVCGEGWGMSEATVFCKENFGEEAVKPYVTSGGFKEVFYDMKCEGSERSLLFCNNSGIRQDGCPSRTLAGVVCNAYPSK